MRLENKFPVQKNATKFNLDYRQDEDRPWY